MVCGEWLRAITLKKSTPQSPLEVWTPRGVVPSRLLNIMLRLRCCRTMARLEECNLEDEQVKGSLDMLGL